MAETLNYGFDHKEITELLIRKQGIHEGLWSIYLEFGLAGGNVNTGLPDDPNLMPAAIVPITRIGIQKVDQPTPLTVDAAQVNPVKAKTGKVQSAKKRKD
ncbi:MAG: hypothetical protein HQK60_11085 [Deltaproteobacteria bacterium]|nr:hypothetical protein [Deltaproteobacteria bacterium]